MQEQHDIRELDEVKSKSAEKVLKLDPNGLEYAEGALRCLSAQLLTARSPNRIRKLEAGIRRWELTVEKLKASA